MGCWWWERVFLEVLFIVMAATQYVFIWHHGPLQREVWVWVILGNRWLIQHIMERNFTEEIYLHIFRHWYMFQWPVNKSLGQVWNKWHWHSSAHEVLCLDMFAVTPHKSSHTSEPLHVTSRVCYFLSLITLKFALLNLLMH